jgi:hypothetical protein
MTVPEVLFEQERHCAATTASWRESMVRNEIRALVEDVIRHRREDGFWNGPESEFPLSLYGGVAGIAWALGQLGARGFIDEEPSVQCRPFLAKDGYPYVSTSLFDEYAVPVSYSYYLGETGPLLQAWRETGETSLLDQLDSLIGRNQTHPWMENLWGAPGTLVVACHLLEATAEERFAEHIRRGADYMWERLEYSRDLDCKLWNISLYGETSALLGAGHGFIGNVFPLCKAWAVLGGSRQGAWAKCIQDTVANTALRSDGLANWSQSTGTPRRGRDAPLVQQCHGAPGFVIALARMMGQGNADFDLLMQQAAELVWQAGPQQKYPGLCHGTPGNGYALLKMYQHTGDRLWLERARQFALTAIAQRKDILLVGGTAQYALWTGDMGLAMFLADCIDARGEFPTLDYF